MTIKGLIDKIQEEKPNSFSDGKLLSFINEVEHETAEQLADTEWTPYDSVDTTELLVPEPYSRLYVSYLKAQIDYSNEEYPSYQLNAEQHAADFKDFVDWVVREHKANTANHTYPKRIRNIL